jgi:hypothetical protein
LAVTTHDENRVQGKGSRFITLCVLMAGINPLAQAQPVQPLHFFVEDSLIRAAPFRMWVDELSREVAAAERLLCREVKRVEGAAICDLSFKGAAIITPFDRPVEDGLRGTALHKNEEGVVGESGLNFLLDQESPSERRVYVVRRLLTCGGEEGVVAGCTRVSGRVTVLGFLGNQPHWPDDTAITLLHELGHQAGLIDGPDQGSLMYRGRPAPRAGIGIKAAELASFRRLLAPP